MTETSDPARTTLESLYAEYEHVAISEDGYIIVAKKEKLVEPPPLIYREVGTTGQTSYGSYLTEEYNPKLRGLLGLRIYDQMRKGDGQVRSSLLLAKTPALGARWFIKPASESTRDTNAAKFIWKNLNELMTITWTQVLYESLLMLDFGYWMFEPVYEPRIVDGEQRIICRKLAPRHPMQVTQWFYDFHGGPEAVEMIVPSANFMPEIVIPIQKLVVFTHQREGGNITGVSALRSAYKHWYFKDNLYKIDAIQKERHGIGVPIIELPPQFNDEDVRLADAIGRNLRVNEKAHVVLPPLWHINWAKIEGYPVQPIDSIDHHNKMIRTNILGDLIVRETGQNDALDYDMYFRACAIIADVVRDTFNLYYIPKLINYNYSRVGMPRLDYWFVPNLRDLSFALRNFVGADLVRPDDNLEDLIRELGHLPTRDESSDRVLELRKFNMQQLQNQLNTPGQLPPGQVKNRGQQPGLPRQAPAGPAGTGGPNVGGATRNSA